MLASLLQHTITVEDVIIVLVLLVLLALIFGRRL